MHRNSFTQLLLSNIMPNNAIAIILLAEWMICRSRNVPSLPHFYITPVDTRSLVDSTVPYGNVCARLTSLEGYPAQSYTCIDHTYLYIAVKHRFTCFHLLGCLFGRVFVFFRQEQHLNVWAWGVIVC